MLQNKDTFTSLELTDLINQYRKQEGNRTDESRINLSSDEDCDRYLEIYEKSCINVSAMYFFNKRGA